MYKDHQLNLELEQAPAHGRVSSNITGLTKKNLILRTLFKFVSGLAVIVRNILILTLS